MEHPAGLMAFAFQLSPRRFRYNFSAFNRVSNRSYVSRLLWDLNSLGVGINVLEVGRYQSKLVAAARGNTRGAAGTVYCSVKRSFYRWISRGEIFVRSLCQPRREFLSKWTRNPLGNRLTTRPLPKIHSPGSFREQKTTTDCHFSSDSPVSSPQFLPTLAKAVSAYDSYRE